MKTAHLKTGATFCTAFLLLLAMAPSCSSLKPEVTLSQLRYPTTRKVAQVDDYHGTKVADPYRWLEDDQSPETKQWVAEENRVTFSYLSNIAARPKIRERLTTLWNYERYGIPTPRGGKYFYTKNDGLQNQAILYVATNLTEPGKILLDPNTLSTNGTVALKGTVLTDDGKLMAYGISAAGSDWEDWKIRDVSTGRDLSDELHWIKFSSIGWTHDGQGFFYSRFDEPDEKTKFQTVNFYQKLYFHKLGTAQSADTLIYERRDHKEWGFEADVTDDGSYLIIQVTEGTSPNNALFYKDLRVDQGPVVELLRDFDASYSFVDNDGETFWFNSNSKAPRGRLIAIDIKHPEPNHWREIIPQSTDKLESLGLVGNQFLANYLHDAHSEVKLFTLEGKLKQSIEFPGIGTASGFGGKRKQMETFYAFSGFTMPATVYRFDLQNGTSSVFRKPKVDFDPTRLETKQVFYTSKDGTRIPMFITGRKGLVLDGHNPTLLFGYGGFDISLTPAFSPESIAWMEMGGVYAVPSLRGGGEYGEEWHLAGTKLKKQNVFDDFIAAAEWLIAHHYTSRDHLAIEGRSNGGLLIGACMTQRPDLFAAACPGVGVMDMLRFEKFTIGWAWTSDYGSTTNREEFAALQRYSPYHNIHDGVSYPATFVTTGDHDDRVVPGHSFKFAARLQEAQVGTNPVLIRIETSAGHGAGKPTSKQIDEATDRLAFLTKELKMDQGRHATFQSRE